MQSFVSDKGVLQIYMDNEIPTIQEDANCMQVVPPTVMHNHKVATTTSATAMKIDEAAPASQQQYWSYCPTTVTRIDGTASPRMSKTTDFLLCSTMMMPSAAAVDFYYSNATAAANPPGGFLLLSSTEDFSRSSSLSNAVDGYHELIRTLQHLGDSYVRLNQYEQALPFYLNAMQAAIDRYGPRHIDVATTLNCVGFIHLHTFNESKTGDVTLAIDCFRRAFEILKFIKHDDSLYSAALLTNLGKAQYYAGEYENSFSNHQEAYRIRKMLLSETHLDVAESLFYAAMSNDRLNNSLLSLHLYQKFLRIFVPQLGSSHSHVVAAYICSGDICLQLESYDNAIDMYTKGIDATKKTFGHQNTIVTDILTKIGHARYHMGDLSNAARAYLECLDLQRRFMAPDNLSIVVTLLKLARVYQQEGYFEESLKVYLEALHIQLYRNDQDRESTLNTSVTLDCIGSLYDILGHSNDGIASYERSLKLKISVLGRNHFEVSSIMNAIGIIHFKEGRFESAISWFEQGLSVRESLPHSTPHDFAAILFNIGAVHMATGESDQALEYFKRTLVLEKDEGEANIMNIMNVLRHIGNLHANRREYTEALECFNEGIEIIENSCRCDLSSELVSFYSLTGTVYLEQGDTDNALRCLMKAMHHERIAGVSGDHDVILRGLIMKRLASAKQVTCAPAA
jgi:tetratricopeptide (TPR) repeat protein